MNKKGFTLVELLAVIVILSLLALLTSTAVTKLVKDAKNDLNSTQIELIKSAAQTWGADNLTGLPEAGKCSYLTLANLKDYGLIDSNIKNLNTNEKISDDLKIKISTIRNEKSNKLITTYEVNPESIEGCYQQVYYNGEVVYFDVTNGEECSFNYTESQSATGVKSGCLKFYAFNDKGGSKIHLLLDHNTTAKVAWTNDEELTNKNGPIDVINQLYQDTKNWSEKIITPNDYIMNQKDQKESIAFYTIKYSEPIEGETTPYKARLITAADIAEITGADKALNWYEVSTNFGYYLDGAKGLDPGWQTQVADPSNKSEYYWLFDRTDGCTEYGCHTEDSSTKGYWTSSSLAGSVNYAWDVNRDGSVAPYVVDGEEFYGVRPIITVLKSDI